LSTECQDRCGGEVLSQCRETVESARCENIQLAEALLRLVAHQVGEELRQREGDPNHLPGCIELQDATTLLSRFRIDTWPIEAHQQWMDGGGVGMSICRSVHCLRIGILERPPLSPWRPPLQKRIDQYLSGVRPTSGYAPTGMMRTHASLRIPHCNTK
jgi:hypothetical protein